MLNAISNIYSINKLVEQSSDDQIIRATNIQLKTDDSTKTYFYVRKNKIDQIFQKLTDWTDGAKAKQKLAKNQIISNLKIIKDNPEFDKKFPNKERREQALVLMNKIIMTVNTTEKDITSSMIKRDLLSLNSFLRTYENIEKKSEHSDPVEDSSEGDFANSEAESDLNAAKGNNTGSNIIEVVGVDKYDGVTVVMQPSETNNFENNIKANISKNMSSILSKLANVTSVDVAEVVLNSVDPLVDGKLAEDTNSSPAESGPTISTTPAPIGKAIEQGSNAAEAATENTPSPVPFSSSSTTAEIKDSAKANPYLESLKTEWDPADDGYHTITKPFFITGGVPTSSMIAEAYLLPVSKQLNFAEEGSVVSSGREGHVVQGKHILHKHGDTDTQRDTRPYLKLSAKGPNSILVGASKVAKNDAMKQQILNRFKTELFQTYLDSFTKINEEYKKINSGRELETLVIVPISGLPGVLTEVESEVLASAVLAIQNENPDLKIHVSAAETLHESRIRSAYEEKIKDPT